MATISGILRRQLAPVCWHALRLSLSAVILFSGVSAQRAGLDWVWQNPLPQGNPLYSIHFLADKERGFAVGADNTILATTDGGFTWRPQFAPSDVNFSDVFVRNKHNAFIVGARGTVLFTDNSGKEWAQVPVDTRDHLTSITLAVPCLTTGWITGTYGRVLKTADGGQTWKSQTS